MVPKLSGLEMCGGMGVDSKGIRDGGVAGKSMMNAVNCGTLVSENKQ